MNDDVRNRCEHPEHTGDIKSVLPVTYGFERHYINKYCAQCHAESESTEHIFWEFEVHCDHSISLNYDRILSIMEENGCNIFFIPPLFTDVEGCNIPSYTVSRCNQSGLWAEYNDTLVRACLAFIDPFNQTYQNVFCYLCNTDVTVTPQRSSDWSCNDPFDVEDDQGPLFSMRLRHEALERRKNFDQLKCDLTRQFPDYKSVSRNDIDCILQQATVLFILHKQILPTRIIFDFYTKQCRECNNFPPVFLRFRSRVKRTVDNYDCTSHVNISFWDF